jgi:3-deoxy-D-manno-octulosonate 8-phosphate phosphatase (KDO 8-P phosphatase)
LNSPIRRRAQLSDAQRDTLKRIRLVVFDVDGTLTDGKVVYSDQGELQSFCVRDGQGLAWLKRFGIQIAWITGRGCAATERRATELGVVELHMQSGPKAEVLRSIQERLGIGREETLSMGDDLPDLALSMGSSFFAAPQDARPEIKKHADWVSIACAGSGAARELVELLLRAQGNWDKLMQSYDVGS